jgi:hypothetical protein
MSYDRERQRVSADAEKCQGANHKHGHHQTANLHLGATCCSMSMSLTCQLLFRCSDVKVEAVEDLDESGCNIVHVYNNEDSKDLHNAVHTSLA